MIIDRNVITFVGGDGRQEFLEALRDEMAYDRACGRVGRVAPALATKIEEMISPSKPPRCSFMAAV